MAKAKFIPTLEEIEEMDSNYEGFCVACGNVQEHCEPDARRYTCEACDESTVYGAQELAIMGFVK